MAVVPCHQKLVTVDWTCSLTEPSRKQRANSKLPRDKITYEGSSLFRRTENPLQHSVCYREDRLHCKTSSVHSVILRQMWQLTALLLLYTELDSTDLLSTASSEPSTQPSTCCRVAAWQPVNNNHSKHIHHLYHHSTSLPGNGHVNQRLFNYNENKCGSN